MWMNTLYDGTLNFEGEMNGLSWIGFICSLFWNVYPHTIRDKLKIKNKKKVVITFASVESKLESDTLHRWYNDECGFI